ncbi:MAG: hypothetical protein IPH45_15840 [Bacteroidales bacterium]|nr:hypothetical protein [Bacteroidales bacterium]
MKNIIYLLLLFIISQSCSMSKDDNETGTTGEGGSLARFTIVGDYLYVVNESSLSTFSLLLNPFEPVKVDDEYLGFGAETIFPYGNELLLGTQSGMYIYDITNPAQPTKITLFQHIRSCDPVVAENGYAYITLNSNNQTCWRGLNEMQVVNIQNPNDAYLLSSYAMSSPQGLDIHSDTLFVCDQGLKMLDVSNKNNPKELKYINNIVAEDVIYTNGRLLIIGANGFHQYAINSNGLTKLSTIPVTP